MDVKLTLQFVTSVVAFIGLVAIWYQLKHSLKLSQYSALTEAHSELGTKEFREALRLIYQSSQDEIGQIDETDNMELRKAFELIAGRYDLIGARLQDGVLPYKGTLKTEWKVVTVLWPKMKQPIFARREGRDTPYKEYFEWLYEQSEAYRQKHYSHKHPRVNLNEGGKPIVDSDFELEAKIVHKGFYLNFWRHESGWEYVQRTRGNGGVIILPVTANNEILFVEQYRAPLKATVLELPAGLVGDTDEFAGEGFEETVSRELFEETGYECEKVEEIVRGPWLPGLTDEINVLCLAKVGSQINSVTQLLVDEKEVEIAKIHKVPIASVLEWLGEQYRNDRVIDLRIYAALFWLPDELQFILRGGGG